MTAEETRQWIHALLDKTLTIHEQGKHYASVDICNVDGSTMVSVTAMKNGWDTNKEYDYYAPCLIDIEPEKITRAVVFLDSLIEDEEVSE